jgi:hypothetical protein
VEVPPGSFDFAPEKPDDNTDSVLNGWYFYGWQAAFPDSVVGDDLYSVHADSFNLSGPSWRIFTDSNWVRLFSMPFTGPTITSAIPESTIVRLCRTRANKLSSDSMFHIVTLWYDTSDYDFTFIDSIPDDSLGVDPNHPFVGFIDTVTHTHSDTGTAADDSLYQLGQPRLFSKDSLDGASGMSADDTLLGTIVYRRYRFHWIDSSTGMWSRPGPYLRVPADTKLVTPGVPLDSIITIITPTFDTTEPRWGVLTRAEELLGSVGVDTLDPSAFSNVAFFNDWLIAYWPDENGRCFQGGTMNVQYNQCRIRRVQPSNPEFILEPYYPVCTVKTPTEGFCDTIVDSFRYTQLRERANAVPFDQQTIGQWGNVTVLQNRVLMSQGSMVYYNGFTGRGSEMGYWPIGNAVAVGTDDGDDITALHAGDRYVDIFKKYKWSRANATGANQFTVYEIKNNIGCIAKHSVVDLPIGGLAFLSMNGFYIYAPAWQSEYKSTGGNIDAMGNQVREHLDAMSFTERSECYGWMDEKLDILIFSFPLLDTSLVMSEGQWSQWDFAPRMTTEYDISPYRYWGILPCSGTVFIEYDDDRIFRFGNIKTDAGDSVEAFWKSLELFQTGGLGKIEEFKLWKYSNTNLGIDFNVWDIADTGVVATRRDSAIYRVKRKDIACPESEGFGVEIKFKGDSLTIDRVDIKYTPTGSMPVD